MISIMGARTLLGAPGIATRSKDAPPNSLRPRLPRIRAQRAWFGGRPVGADDSFGGAEDVLPSIGEESELVSLDASDMWR